MKSDSCQKVSTTNTKLIQLNTSSYTGQKRIHKILTFCATDIPILIILIFDKYFIINLKYFNLLNFLLTVVFRKKDLKYCCKFYKKKKCQNFVDGYLFKEGSV